MNGTADIDGTIRQHFHASADTTVGAQDVNAVMRGVAATKQRRRRSSAWRRGWPWRFAPLAFAVLLGSTAAAFIAGSSPSPQVSPSPSPSEVDSVIPVLPPCPLAATTQPCVAFGTALLQDWHVDGTMSAIELGFQEASFPDESRFMVRFGSPSGDGFTITGPAFPGIAKADPRLVIEFTGPFLADRAPSDKTDCVLSVSSVPPPTIEGQFACGPAPATRNGPGVSGHLAASFAPGVLAFAMSGGGPYPTLYEAGLRSPIDPSASADTPLDLVYDTAGLGTRDFGSMVEITGTPSGEGTLGDAHVLFTGYPWGSVDAPCDVRLEWPAEGPRMGSFTCTAAAMGEAWDLEVPVEGAFTAGG